MSNHRVGINKTTLGDIKKKDDKSRGFLKVLPNRLYEIQKVAQMIGITLLSYGLAGIKMLSCFFAVIIALSAALVPQLYLS